MSNQSNTTALLSSKVVAPAVRDLDLGIALISDTVVRLPFGSMRMHASAPRAVTAD
jgi:hypothetical protein